MESDHTDLNGKKGTGRVNNIGIVEGSPENPTEPVVLMQYIQDKLGCGLSHLYCLT